MARVATIPLQRTLSDAIMRSQEKLAVTQAQLSTGKKATTYADLGTETVRNLSAHSMLARQEAQSTVAKRVDTSLSLYQGSLEGIDTATSELRVDVLNAIGTGKADGLQEAVQSAFSQFRSALNLSEGGAPLFGGSQTVGDPFIPASLAEVAATDADAAFQDDGIKSSARIADGVDLTYGISASSAGKDLYAAFRTLAQAGPFGETPTEDQITALKTAMDQIDKGLTSTRSVNAENGRKQAQLETMTKRNDERALLLSGVIESNEDADLGQVAIDLAQQKAVLEASYSVFSQLSSLSLVNYIR
ncbi:flagellin [Sphingomonas sp. IC-56]|uniref:flagellin N-terminal helical domain-containing protein n=1 Tax=Sphingomonas sp. IC-56 TaxID=2898529 RepID=UPI001E38AC1A|nr:flagellin [Sphingomonas sp. IC-56]MCD2324212.1 flagellin [Sphingomonas sp. IC-56]